ISSLQFVSDFELRILDFKHMAARPKTPLAGLVAVATIIQGLTRLRRACDGPAAGLRPGLLKAPRWGSRASKLGLKGQQARAQGPASWGSTAGKKPGNGRPGRSRRTRRPHGNKLM
ncbi:MAG: hypothetical protein KAU28_01450, partial [Phycisphaerae bacterium]|nr:hypothetical protein [Phycisphaerae bacterium]